MKWMAMASCLNAHMSHSHHISYAIIYLFEIKTNPDKLFTDNQPNEPTKKASYRAQTYSNGAVRFNFIKFYVFMVFIRCDLCAVAS